MRNHSTLTMLENTPLTTAGRDGAKSSDDRALAPGCTIMMRSRPLARRGFTLIEIVITMGIMGMSTLVIAGFVISVFRYNRTLGDQIDAEIQLRKAVTQFTAELRTASISSLGAYPLDTADEDAIIFYSNIDSDTLKERVRYFLDNNTLKKGVVKPSGSPLIYNLAGETIVTLIDNVRNTDVFAYYDDSYSGSSPPLSFPVNISQVRLVRLTLSVDRDVNRPPSAMMLETNVHLRNL